jgi:Domain of unknown function (DUF4418)
VVTAVSKRKASRRIVAGIGTLLGIFVILLPTALVGVCASPDMLCNSIMKPTLIMAGLLTIVISLGAWIYSERQPEQSV